MHLPQPNSENLVKNALKSKKIKARSKLICTRFVQKVSGLTTEQEVDKAYAVLTLFVFNIVPFRSCTLRPTLLPLLETFCELLFRDV